MNHLDNSKHQQSNVDDRLKKKSGDRKSDEEREREKTQDGRWRHVHIDRSNECK